MHHHKMGLLVKGGDKKKYEVVRKKKKGKNPAWRLGHSQPIEAGTPKTDIVH